MRITGRYLNHLKAALFQRSAILNNVVLSKSIVADGSKVNQIRENLYGEDVKIVRQHTLNLKLLTPTEKDEIVTKYKNGMTMTAIANQYGCHYTTVGRVLRINGVEIRKK